MNWWIVGGIVAAVFVAWGVVGHLFARRAGTHRTHYSDGCAKPLVEPAFRADGTPKNIIPKPGDGDVDDLEHLLSHDGGKQGTFRDLRRKMREEPEEKP